MTWLRWKRLVLTILAAIILGGYLFPVFWMVSSSFKSEKDIVAMKWLPSQTNLENYSTVLERAKIGRWFFNSLIVSVFSTFGVVIISLLAGYSLGRLEFPGKHFLFLLMLSSFMIRFEAIMIPMF